MIKLDQIKNAFIHAFKITDGHDEMTEDDFKLFEKLSSFVVKRKLTVPATMFLETMRPLNMVGNSMMSFFRPTLGNLFNHQEYARLERILERRCSVEVLIDTIEKMDDEYQLNKKKK